MKLVADPDASAVSLSLELCGSGALLCEAFFDGKKVGEAKREYAEGLTPVELKLSECHPWQVGSFRFAILVELWLQMRSSTQI